MKNLEIKLYGHTLGVLSQTLQGVAFEYYPEFKRSGLDLSPLQLPLDGKQVFVSEPEWRNTNGLPGVFNDSLPDRFGNNLLAAHFLSKGRLESDIDVFDKLQYVGTRGMGAIEYHPGIDTEPLTRAISLEEIEQVSKLGTASKEKLQTHIDSDHSLLDIIEIGTSAGGARAKALIAINEENGEIRSGQIPQPEAFTYYLIKIDGANEGTLSEPSGYGRLEYAYYQMVRDSGIDMAPSKLYADTHFLTQRFDRTTTGEKIHVHSLCGIAGLDYHNVGGYSYENYFMVARQLGLGIDSFEEMFRRMVFNVLAHNCDDHTKNFSFMMLPSGEWKLSPAFDMSYSYKSSNEWVNGHNMRVNGKRTAITTEDLLAIGRKFNVSKRKRILQDVNEVVNRFAEYAEENKVKAGLIEDVELHRPKLIL